MLRGDAADAGDPAADQQRPRPEGGYRAAQSAWAHRAECELLPRAGRADGCDVDVSLLRGRAARAHRAEAMSGEAVRGPGTVRGRAPVGIVAPGGGHLSDERGGERQRWLSDRPGEVREVRCLPGAGALRHWTGGRILVRAREHRLTVGRFRL